MSALWSAEQYGWHHILAVTIDGIAECWVERPLTITLPDGRSVQDKALICDHSAEIGQEAGRTSGIGQGYPLSFQLDSTVATNAYMRAPAHVSKLALDCTAGATTLTVDDTTGWPSSGTLYIGLERITYTGTTPTTFTGCTRGTAESLARPHYTGSGSSVLTEVPQWWRGRTVRLFGIGCNPAGIQAGTPELLWCGTISEGPNRTQDGTWAFNALSLDRRLAEPLPMGATGKVIDAVARHAVTNPTATFQLYVKVPGLYEHTVSFQPFSAFAVGDLLTPAEQMAAIKSAWDAAVVAAGLGSDLGTLAFYQFTADSKTYTGILAEPATYKGAWGVSVVLKNTSGSVVQWAYVQTTIDGKALNANAPAQPVLISAGAQSPVPTGWQTSGDFSTGQAVAAPPAFTALALQLDTPYEALPQTGWLVIEDTGQSIGFKSTTVQGGLAYFGGMTLQGGAPVTDPTSLVGKKASIQVNEGAATMGEAMLKWLESGGGGGLYDQWPVGCGLAIPADLIDEASFLTGLGAWAGLGATIKTGGQSFADVFGGVLALAQRAVVLRGDASGGVRIGLISTDPGGSDYLATVTDTHLLSFDAPPVVPLDRTDAPNQFKVTCRTSADLAVITVRDGPSANAQGTVEHSFTVPIGIGPDGSGSDLTHVRERVTSLAASLFAQSQTMQELELHLVPWAGPMNVGDLIWFQTIHHAAWQFSTGQQGYSGTARVVGVKRAIGGAVTANVLVDGAAHTRSLCPAGLVQDFDDPASPAWVEIPLKFATHFAKEIKLNGGLPVRLTHYQPGAGDETGGGYVMVGTALSTGTACRLYVSSYAGLATALSNLPTLPSYLTLPKTADCSTFQSAFAHMEDGSTWV